MPALRPSCSIPCLKNNCTRKRWSWNYHLNAGTESFAESLTYFPRSSEFHTGPEEYLNHIRKAKDAVDIPIIASLNGSTLGGWTSYAKQSRASWSRRDRVQHLLHSHQHRI